MAIGKIENCCLKIEYLTDTLRIVGITPFNRSNILADLNDFAPISTPYGDFEFKGGHRLWHSPESMPRTYVPDSNELIIQKSERSVVLETPFEPITGIRKRIEIEIDPIEPRAVITHSLINDTIWPVELAPWTITQFRPGGIVIMPMPLGDAASLLPNRQLCFWPYAKINDSRLVLGDDYCFFKGEPINQPFKMGYFNPHGWLGYYLNGLLFTKKFGAISNLQYPDMNCNAEVYGIDKFVELESLAPMTILQPSGIVTHQEIWEVSEGLEKLPTTVRAKIVSLQDEK